MRWNKPGLAIITVLLLLIMGCATSRGSSGSLNDDTSKNVSKSSQDLTLVEHLRNLSSVTVHGSGNNITVSIRNNRSLNSSDPRQPLYVLNGQQIGHRFSEVAARVSKGSVTSVRALTPSQSARYGSEGGAGVILIETKDG